MKRRASSVTLALLIALASLFCLRLIRHKPPSVNLPAASQTETNKEALQNGLRRLEVTPQTVRLVIETLTRPENYRRTCVVERFWNGGSAIVTAEVWAADGWTRVEQTNQNDETRHSILSPEECWIWYDGGVYHGASALTADEELNIPTYENILRLTPSEIAVADYRLLNGLDCVYVETTPDSAGYVDRYHVAVDSGLLVEMERLLNGAAVYQMSALSVERGTVNAEAFSLPDGTLLHDPLA